jgi:immunity protein 35 of polymorphic toxin system
MTTLEEAKQLAHEHIKPYQDSIREEFPNDTLELEHTTEFDEGWLFFFSSKLFLETRNIIYRSMGLGPVIVGKENGEIYQAGSGGNEELWIEEFKEFLQSAGKS